MGHYDGIVYSELDSSGPNRKDLRRKYASEEINYPGFVLDVYCLSLLHIPNVVKVT